MMEVRASVRFISISPQKLRLVIDQVRGMDAEQAVTTLKFMPQKGAAFVSKAVASAMANAENNFDLDPTAMYVQTIFADEGPTQKRFKAGARGRYKPRVRRTSHLTVILAERGEK
jgi:large subunit ribosomal protein L22